MKSKMLRRSKFISSLKLCWRLVIAFSFIDAKFLRHTTRIKTSLYTVKMSHITEATLTTSKKILKYSRNHHNFLVFFSYENKRNFGRGLTCSCTAHLFPLLSFLSHLQITKNVLLYNKVRD